MRLCHYIPCLSHTNTHVTSMFTRLIPYLHNSSTPVQPSQSENSSNSVISDFSCHCRKFKNFKSPHRLRTKSNNKSLIFSTKYCIKFEVPKFISTDTTKEINTIILKRRVFTLKDRRNSVRSVPVFSYVTNFLISGGMKKQQFGGRISDFHRLFEIFEIISFMQLSK
jgi:hypothetical protein